MGSLQRAPNAVNHQHYVPEFYLKRFASDAERLKILTMTRRHVHLIEEERSIEYTCAKTRIYRDREEEITRLENVVQRSATWTLAVAGRRGPLSTNDARDLFRTVNHFSVRTPLSRGFLRRLAEQSVDLTHLGSDLDDAFENMSTAYEAWDRMFHLASVRILHTDTDLLTSAFPTSSFEDGLDVNDVTFPYHVTMAIDRRVPRARYGQRLRSRRAGEAAVLDCSCRGPDCVEAQPCTGRPLHWIGGCRIPRAHGGIVDKPDRSISIRPRMDPDCGAPRSKGLHESGLIQVTTRNGRCGTGLRPFGKEGQASGSRSLIVSGLGSAFPPSPLPTPLR